MTAERSNVLAFGPLPIGWLHLPLTQERAAAIVQFQARTGIDLIPHLLDALDDIVFDLGPTRQPGGNRDHRVGARPGEGANGFVLSRGETCIQHQAIHPQPPPKSADTFRRLRTELSLGPSDLSQGSSGRETPRHSSPLSCAETCEQPDAGSAERSTRPPMSGPSCSPSPRIQTDLCGNKD
jgi:hypothetical protein